MGHRVDRAGWGRLVREHAAVLVATGLQRPRALDIAGATDGAVEQGLDFLARGCTHVADVCGDGGGGRRRRQHGGGRGPYRPAARGARGAHRVSTHTRRDAGDRRGDRRGARGGRADRRAARPRPSSAGATGRRVLVCRRMALGEPDESGRPRPVARQGEGALVEVPCDRLLLALGQERDLSLLPRTTADSLLAGGSVPAGLRRRRSARRRGHRIGRRRQRTQRRSRHPRRSEGGGGRARGGRRARRPDSWRR